MTRENKLALVIGFGLILFVGILISDHFSVARNQPSANLAGATDPLVAAAQPQPQQQQVQPAYVNLLPPPAVPAVNTSEVSNAQASAADPHLIQQLAEPQGPANGANLPTQTIDPTLMASANGAQQPIGNEVVPTPNHQQQPPAIDVNLNATTSTQQPTIPTQTANTGLPEGFEPVETNAPAQPTKFHDVAPGESLYAIVKAEYGSAARVQEIAKLNNLSDPSKLKSGQRLRLPVEASATAEATNTAPAANAPAAKPKSPAPKNPAPVRLTYTVKKGDSLTVIAQRVLGSQKRWKELYDINRNVIRDPDNLEVGVSLSLPDQDTKRG